MTDLKIDLSGRATVFFVEISGNLTAGSCDGGASPLARRVVAGRGERNGAEVGQRGVLEHDLGELLGPVSSDVVEADAATRARTKVSAAADTLPNEADGQGGRT